ncbi:MAG: glycosyltransferase family 4 protein, partial [Armatimonadetes bacterium]|nr:glycosyltransferase family 4 protein [Armatimonadota bacterium]
MCANLTRPEAESAALAAPHPMRVLLICYIYPPEVAPAGAMALELAEHLAAQGHQVTVLTAFPNHPHGVVFEGYRRRWREWEQREPFGVLRVWHTISPKRSAVQRLLFYASFALSTLVHGWAVPRPDIIFGITTPLVGGLAGLLLARLRRSRFVHVVWDVYPEAAIQLGVLRPGRLADLLRRLDTWVCRCSDMVAVLSQGLRNVLLTRRLPEERVEVLPIWIDADEIRPLPRANAWRAEQQIDAGAFVVLYAGTIGLISGAEFVVDVAQRVGERDADVLFLLVGEGLVKDRIAQEAARRGLRNIRLLPFQPRERLAEVQATADVSLVTLLPGQGLTSVPSKVLGYMSGARA